MKDFLGNELQEGNEVVYIEKYGGALLNLGIIDKIDRGTAYIRGMQPDGTYGPVVWGSKGKSIMKLNLQKNR